MRAVLARLFYVDLSETPPPLYWSERTYYCHRALQRLKRQSTVMGESKMSSSSMTSWRRRPSSFCWPLGVLIVDTVRAYVQLAILLVYVRALLSTSRARRPAADREQLHAVRWPSLNIKYRWSTKTFIGMYSTKNLFFLKSPASPKILFSCLRTILRQRKKTFLPVTLFRGGTYSKKKEVWVVRAWFFGRVACR